MNQRPLAGLPHDEAVAACRPALVAAFGADQNWPADGCYATPAEWLAQLVDAVRGEVSAEAELAPAVAFAWGPPTSSTADAAGALAAPCAGAVLSRFAAMLHARGCAEREGITALFRELRAGCREAYGLRGRDVMAPIRAALTGRLEGPCLEVVVGLLGKERCLERVRRLPANPMED